MDWEKFARAVELRDAGKLEEARREFHALVEADIGHEARPGDAATVALNEVSCLVSLKQYARAEHRFAEIRQMSNSAMSLAVADLVESEILLAQGRNREALAVIDRALDERSEVLHEPELSFLYGKLVTARGFALANLGHWNEAMPVLHEAESLQQETAVVRRIHLYLGLCLSRSKQPNEARSELDQALGEDSEPDVRAKAHYNIGVLYYEKGGFAAAIQHLLETEKGLSDFDWPHAELYRLLSESFAAVGEEQRSHEYADLAKQTRKR